jgi:hypothetical protein
LASKVEKGTSKSKKLYFWKTLIRVSKPIELYADFNTVEKTKMSAAFKFLIIIIEVVGFQLFGVNLPFLYPS